MIDVFDNDDVKINLHQEIDISKLELDPIVSAKEADMIKNVYAQNPILNNKYAQFTVGEDKFNELDPWIQTYSGKRFTPTNPQVEAIVIQDIAHSLSMQCRFSGHVSEFYSVAQHSVLVSYICNFEDALWGLLHDGSEAFLVDVPSPLKKSLDFKTYRDCESKVQNAICKRFGLSIDEPPSVKKADRKLLATEARDLLKNLRSDWHYPVEPLAIKIDPWDPKTAEANFLKRFNELINER